MIDLIALLSIINAVLLILGGVGLSCYILYGPRFPPPSRRGSECHKQKPVSAVGEE